MSIVLVAHTSVNATATSGNVDTTGASLLVAAIAAGTPGTIVDSKANAWTPLTLRDTVSRYSLRLFYAWKPIVGTGHNFSPTAGNGSTAIAAFSGIEKGVDPFIVENGVVTAASDVGASAGIVSPPGRETLIVTAFGIDDPAGNTIACSGFTITDTIDVVVGSQYGVSLAFQVQIKAATVNPAWTRSTTNAQAGDAAAVAAFQGVYFPPRWGVSPSVRR